MYRPRRRVTTHPERNVAPMTAPTAGRLFTPSSSAPLPKGGVAFRSGAATAAAASLTMAPLRIRVAAALLALVAAGPCRLHASGVPTAAACDVVVYGATPAGVSASVAAARLGAKSCLVGPNNRVGGMMSGGLGWDDVTPASMAAAAGLSEAALALSAIYGGGLYTELIAAIHAHYASISSGAARLSELGTKHEPHVAESALVHLLAEAGVVVTLGADLVKVSSQAPGGDGAPRHISSITVATTNGTLVTIEGAQYVDATYEGDLFARAGAPFRMGRESRREYGEVNAGVVFQNSDHTFLRGSTGAASPLLPSMTWRLCFTNNASNRVPLQSPPQGYNRTRYLGYVADVDAGRMTSVWGAWSGPRPLPPDGTKFDINCNPRPLGFIWAGPQKELLVNATGDARRRLIAELRNLTIGLLWFQRERTDTISRPPHQPTRRMSISRLSAEKGGLSPAFALFSLCAPLPPHRFHRCPVLPACLQSVIPWCRRKCSLTRVALGFAPTSFRIRITSRFNSTSGKGDGTVSLQGHGAGVRLLGFSHRRGANPSTASSFQACWVSHARGSGPSAYRA